MLKNLLKNTGTKTKVRIAVTLLISFVLGYIMFSKMNKTVSFIIGLVLGGVLTFLGMVNFFGYERDKTIEPEIVYETTYIDTCLQAITIDSIKVEHSIIPQKKKKVKRLKPVKVPREEKVVPIVIEDTIKIDYGQPLDTNVYVIPFSDGLVNSLDTIKTTGILIDAVRKYTIDTLVATHIFNKTNTIVLEPSHTKEVKHIEVPVHNKFYLNAARNFINEDWLFGGDFQMKNGLMIGAQASLKGDIIAKVQVPIKKYK